MQPLLSPLQEEETVGNSTCVLKANASSRLSLPVVMLLWVFLCHTLIKIFLPGSETQRLVLSDWHSITFHDIRRTF